MKGVVQSLLAESLEKVRWTGSFRHVARVEHKYQKRSPVLSRTSDYIAFECRDVLLTETSVSVRP